jgi:hypothetical protein
MASFVESALALTRGSQRDPGAARRPPFLKTGRFRTRW